MDTIQLAKELTALRNRRTALEAELDEVKTQYQQTSHEFLRLIESEGLERVTVDGFTVFPQQEVRASIADQDAAFDYFRTGGMGDIIKPAIHNRTLVSTVKQLLEAGELDMAQAESVGLKIHMQDVVRVRKA